MSLKIPPMLNEMRHDIKVAWKDLVLTDIVYKAVGFLVLTPLVGILLKSGLSLYGKAALSDQDIVFFIMGPIGWLTIIIVGGGWLTIAALEQVALMAIVANTKQDQRMCVRTALAHTIPLLWPIFQITVRIAMLGCLVTAPFLLALGVIHWFFLSEFDISYYLIKQPPSFWTAVVLSLITMTLNCAVLVRVLLPAIYALPLLFFEGTSPKECLPVSREHTKGHVRGIATWLLIWGSITLLFSTAMGMGVSLLGTVVEPWVPSSPIWFAIIVIGILLLILGTLNLVVSVLSVTSFAVLLTNLYYRIKDRTEYPLRPCIIDYDVESTLLHRISRPVWLLIFTAGFILSPAVSIPVLRSVQTEDHTKIMAHRGASAFAPENSIAAIEKAIEDGSDWIEIDVQESSDGVIMVIHDADLKKLANLDIKVWEATAQELQQIDIGSSFDPQFADQRIPTLDTVLNLCKDRVDLVIELKHNGHAKRLEKRVIEVIETHDMQDQIMLMSLDYQSVLKMRRMRPDWTFGFLSTVAVGDLTKLEVDFLAVRTNIASRRFMALAGRHNKDIHVWTVNDPITMSTMISRGAASLITDKPALAHDVLQQRAQLSSFERLLLELAMLFNTPSPLTEEKP